MSSLSHPSQGYEVSLDRRLRFLEWGQESAQALLAFRPVVEAHVDEILDGFYRHVSAFPEMAQKFGAGPEMQERAKSLQRKHWIDYLFAGDFGPLYVAQAVRIGQVHQRIGLDHSWYIGGYAYVASRLQALAAETYSKKPKLLAQILAASTKAILLDMDLAISVYIETAREEGQKLMKRYADDFLAEVGEVVTGVNDAAQEMQVVAVSLSESANEGESEVGQMVKSADLASVNVQAVASAAEELSASITEISRQVSHSAGIAAEAVSEAHETDVTVDHLIEAAHRIGRVAQTINAVANKTNLLALNATIEAARAGEAGKGFAVVAEEVKLLAGQTAAATREIETQIHAVQAATTQTAEAMRSIVGTIEKMDGITSAIAAAVEEQGAATEEIARSVGEASQGTFGVTEMAGGVLTRSKGIGHSSSQVLNSANGLTHQSVVLSQCVESFLKKVRSL